MKKIPIVIDCDPGVDDSYAIALANSSPLFDIKAITPVEGNVPAVKTRKNALCLREMLGIDCRVAFGADRPLKKEYSTDASGTHGASGVGTVVFPESKLPRDEKPAWDVIYEEAVKADGELILFAVGPLTNIAITLEKHPDLPKYLKKFVIMGGGTFGNVTKSGETAEFNIWIDPTAAKQVFEKMEVWMVGLNSTHSAALSREDFNDMIKLSGDSEKAYLVRELSKYSQVNSFDKGQDNNVIHDALAVASVINPDVLRFEKHYVYVEDGDVTNNGQTVIDLEDKSGKEPNCYVGMEADKELFAKIIKEMCAYYGSLK